MKWTIEYSRSSDEFIAREDISLVVGEQIESFLKKMRGEKINIDVKKLKGKWKGYLRIKKGKLRVIFTVNFGDRVLYVERVDFRGKAYK
jgi:mRNA interferase RelE/StbE